MPIALQTLTAHLKLMSLQLFSKEALLVIVTWIHATGLHYPSIDFAYFVSHYDRQHHFRDRQTLTFIIKDICSTMVFTGHIL